MVPVEFVLFGLMLAGVARFHERALECALAGLAAITAYKLAFTGFDAGPGLAGLVAHLRHEWVVLVNLLALLLGFAVLARHFEESRVPQVLPRVLPDDWKGGFVLLLLIFVLSSFLDNIAAAIIGGTIASTVFGGRLHVGYLAAIVAAANAGGAGSVIGDTTTTMMWLEELPPQTSCTPTLLQGSRCWSARCRHRCSSSASPRSWRIRRRRCASTGRGRQSSAASSRLRSSPTCS